MVKPAELTDAVAHMRADTRVLGAAVTMPHTVAISRLLDGLGPEAQVVRAVDTISHRAGALIGWNTDRSAFNLALEEAGFQAKGRTALVLGAWFALAVLMVAVRRFSIDTWSSLAYLAAIAVWPVFQYAWTFFYLRLIEAEVPEFPEIHEVGPTYAAHDPLAGEAGGTASPPSVHAAEAASV